MKRIALFFAIVVAAVSCAPEVTITPEIKVVTEGEGLVLSPQEGAIPVAFSVNTDWKATIKEAEAKEWCAISPAKGKPGDNVLNVLCIENKGTDNRTATVVISAMDITQEVVITQLQKDVLVLTAEKEYAVPYQGKELTFKLTHNNELKAVSSVDWITQAPTKAMVDSELTFVVAPNTSEARTGTITFSAGPFEEVITVNQDAWVLEFAVAPEEDKAFDAAGGEHKVTVNSNVDYTVTMNQNNWLTMTNQGNEYTFKALANESLNAREVEVVIAPKSAKYVSYAKRIKLSQKAAGAKLEVSATEVRVTCPAQTFELTVDATIDYTMAYKKVVEDEYVDLPASERWLSHNVSDKTVTFSVTENTEWTERSLVLVFTPKDAAYVDQTKEVFVYQYGHAFRMWLKQLTAIQGYDSSQKVKLAKYGEKILLANTTKVFVLDPATGDVEATINMPQGAIAHSLLVDDAGNVLIAADGGVGEDMTLYYVADPMNPAPEVLLTYNTGNYYGSQTGNFRVKGNIKGNAVITAVVSDGQDGDNIEDGAVLVWEVVNGACGEWKWTNAPYTAWGVESLCAYPRGSKLTDGLFYIGYGGSYNLMYAAAPVMDPVKNDDGAAYVNATNWVTSYVTGSSWMENYNCMSTATWKGSQYAAILMGCHFNYDDADMLLLNVNNPASATHYYTYSGTYDVVRDDAWANTWWTGTGANSDILLIPTEDALLMVGADSNYGTLTCVAIM